MELAIDESRWPLVVLGAETVQPTGAALDRFFAAIVALLERREPHVLVIDTRRMTMPTDSHGREVIRGLLRDPVNRELASRYKVCDVVIARSVLFQAAMSAIHWIEPPANPLRAFRSGVDAIDWVRAHCERSGLPFTDEMAEALGRF